MITLKISFKFHMEYSCYKFCEWFMKTKTEIWQCWATEENFHFRDFASSAISSYDLNELGEKLNENYWKFYNEGHNIWEKREIPSKPQTIWNCSKLGWKGRFLTLSFKLDLRLRRRTLGSEDPKVPKWSNKAQNIA